MDEVWNSPYFGKIEMDKPSDIFERQYSPPSHEGLQGDHTACVRVWR